MRFKDKFCSIFTGEVTRPELLQQEFKKLKILAITIMELPNFHLDESVVFNELDRIVAETVPDELDTWNLDGNETFRDLLKTGISNDLQGVPEAPRFSPEIMETLKWTSLVLGCVKAIFEVGKLIVELSNNQTSDERIKQVVAKHLSKLSVPTEAREKICDSLAKAIRKAVSEKKNDTK